MQREDWMLRNLRGTRAKPPFLAAADPRRRTLYGGALEQFEQLLHAAEVVGPAARPLPLFYALSQAGRAIVAARGEDPDVDGHGLVEDRRQPPPRDLLHRRVKPAPTKRGRDAFGAVSRAIGSAELVAPVELGAVWTALHGIHRFCKASWLPEWRPSLEVLDDTFRGKDGETRVQVLSLLGNPHHDAISTLRGRYPSLPADVNVAVKAGPEELGAGGWIAVMTWDAKHKLEDVAPSDGHHSKTPHLSPTLPGHERALSPLMMWWVLLFGLSIFARYHPGVWAQTLDVDESEHAVPLEAVLDRAVDVLPGLVHAALLE